MSQPDGPAPWEKPTDDAAPAEPGPPLPKVPGVTLQREIARGGMGVVYVGRQDFLDRTVAVKLLSISLNSDEFAARFQREAKLLAGIKHPNIVACHDAGVNEDGLYYLVMEFINGPTLKHWLANNGPLPVPVALRMTKALASALEHAYSLGVIHRDVKPENILLETATSTAIGVGPPLVPKLVDLGLARMQSESAGLGLTSPGAVMGTPMTMSPEQFDDPDSVDFRTDIYGLGCALFEMLTGKPAYAATKLTELVIKKREPLGPNPCKALTWLADGIGDLVCRMLAADRDDRPESYRALIDEIDVLLTDVTVPDGTTAKKAAPKRDPIGFDKTMVQDTGTRSESNAADVVPDKTQGILRSTELNFLAGDGGGTAPPSSPFQETPGPGQQTRPPVAPGSPAKSRGLAIGGIAALALAAIGVGVWMFFGDGKPPTDNNGTPNAATTAKQPGTTPNGQPETPNGPAVMPPPNQAPTAPTIAGPKVITLQRPTKFKATAQDPDGDKLGYRWSSPQSKFVTFAPSDAAETSVFVLDGLENETFEIEVEVDDKHGHTAMAQHSIAVAAITARPFLSGFIAPETPWEVDDAVGWFQNPEDLSVRATVLETPRMARRDLGDEAFWHVVGFAEPTRFRDPDKFGASGVRIEAGDRAWDLLCTRSGADGVDWSITLTEFERAGDDWRAVETQAGKTLTWQDPSGECPGAFVAIKRRQGQLTFQYGCAEQRMLETAVREIGDSDSATLALFVNSVRGVFRDFRFY